ncbi:hypothetical protein [Corynebacterium sanguinis]|uniref:Uncharacterized protein n=1 Tax=Corynebacterium sanguinis TaxID=2594913 RepID=A0A6C1TUC0_9CORY|nr:hypothetical protein [Corynebacterium sanguinis]TVS26145.1 hypothetical protein EKI59_11160 [Corynebacterium sanguinis]
MRLRGEIITLTNADIHTRRRHEPVWVEILIHRRHSNFSARFSFVSDAAEEVCGNFVVGDIVDIDADESTLRLATSKDQYGRNLPDLVCQGERVTMVKAAPDEEDEEE